ncbi:MAG TPA: hypothetical protein VLC71_12795 [Thermomonas sp.]|nr:hypothetical protein [Thermomonas sp.]
MTIFEFVFGMISVITSLALTRLLSGCVGLYRNTGRIRFSWRHGCWIAVAMMVLIGNWASFWQRRDWQAWGPLDVLIPLVFIVVLYAFCDLVMPDEPREGQVLDLHDYHARQGKRYKAMHLVFAALALLVIARHSGSFGEWLDGATFALVAAVATAAALRARSTWLDALATIALVMLAPLFMWSSLQALSG